MNKRILIARALEKKGALYAKEIEQELGVKYNLSSLLADLENKGQIKWVPDPYKIPYTAGFPRRLYSLTEEGKRLVRNSYGTV